MSLGEDEEGQVQFVYRIEVGWRNETACAEGLAFSGETFGLDLSLASKKLVIGGHDLMMANCHVVSKVLDMTYRENLI